MLLIVCYLLQIRYIVGQGVRYSKLINPLVSKLWKMSQTVNLSEKILENE